MITLNEYQLTNNTLLGIAADMGFVKEKGESDGAYLSRVVKALSKSRLAPTRFKSFNTTGEGITKYEFDQLKSLYSRDQTAAGEAAIALVEEALFGQHSCEETWLNMTIDGWKLHSKSQIESNSKDDRALKHEEFLRFVLTEQLVNRKLQKDVAKELGVTQSVVSHKMKMLKETYPDFYLKILEEVKAKIK